MHACDSVEYQITSTKLTLGYLLIMATAKNQKPKKTTAKKAVRKTSPKKTAVKKSVKAKTAQKKKYISKNNRSAIYFFT